MCHIRSVRLHRHDVEAREALGGSDLGQTETWSVARGDISRVLGDSAGKLLPGVI